MQETAVLDKYVKKTKGSKNIPMLNVITACYVHTCTLSVNSTAVPPKVELLRSQDLKVRRARVVGLASVKCLLEVVGLINVQGADTLSAYDM